MYVEIKSPSGTKKYVYLKRSVRVGSKVKHITVERYGELSKLESMHPGFVEHLSKLCAEGSPDLFSSKMLAFDRNIKQAIAHATDSDEGSHKDEHDAQEESAKGSSLPPHKVAMQEALDPAMKMQSSSMLFLKPQTSLNRNDQQLLLDTYAPHLNLINKVASDDAQAAGDDALEVYVPEGLIDAVVVAAGVGKRMGSSIPKQYLKLDDKCILEHTVLKLLSSPYIRRVVLVLSAEDEYFKNTCLSDLERVKVVNGGKERVDSVLCGLGAVETSWCLVHDAARPLISLDDIEQLLFSVAHGVGSGYSGGLLVSKVADTLKKSVRPDSSKRSLKLGAPSVAVKKTVDRSRMYRAQTPQLFRTKELTSAISRALADKQNITDEASAMELDNKKVLLIEGSPLNFKVTEPSDLLIVKALLSYCAPKC